MNYHRLTVLIDELSFAKLLRLAELERRDSRSQAQVVLERALRRAQVHPTPAELEPKRPRPLATA
jgi:hypothetical protein